MEANTNRILKGENLDKQMLIASTTKILTAITVIENYDLDEKLCVNKIDTLSIGSKVYLKENEYISRRDLLYALMLRSANDAASVLSENNSNEFIRLMNETAKKIGMYNSVFENASGLDESDYNLSTAYDMALLGAYASKNEVFVKVSSSHTYKCMTEESNYVFTNKHKLVKNDENFVWGKTGFTKKSSRVLVSNYIKDKMNLIVVTINDSDDWNHHKKFVDNLDEYEFMMIYKKGVYDTKLDIEYYLYLDQDLIIPIKKEEYDDIKISFILRNDKAIFLVHYKDILIVKRDVKVYYKNTFDPDLMVEMLF
jgi:D-alanyl-D-alanine carboxypeptidase